MTENLRPSAVKRVSDSLENMYNALLSIGLTHDDVVTLIYRRCKNKVSRTDIDEVISAIRAIESAMKEAVGRDGRE